MKNIAKQKRTAITVSKIICVLMVIGLFIMAKFSTISFAKTEILDRVKKGNGRYTVVSMDVVGGKIVRYDGMVDTSATSVTIPDTIKIGGEVYSVGSINKDALKGKTQLKSVTIGKNISFIGKNAFKNCKNLKNITVKSIGLTAKGTKSNAFSGINSKAIIKVPISKVDDYKTLLKGKGLKTQSIIGKKMDSEAPEYLVKSLQEPLAITLNTGGYLHTTTGEYTPDYWTEDDHSLLYKTEQDTMSYNAGDTIHFSMGFYLNPEIYGSWHQKPMYTKVTHCNVCGKRFSSPQTYADHTWTADCRGMWFSFSEEPVPFIEDYFVRDDSPCSVELHISLPDGIPYQEGSLKLRHYNKNMNNKDIDSSAYHTEFLENEIVITIDNLKAKEIMLDRERENPSYEILFNLEMPDTAPVTSITTGTLSYSYKGVSKTVDFPEVSVHAATMELTVLDGNNDILVGDFALYKSKNVYTSTISNGNDNVTLGTPKFYKIAQGTSGEAPLVFGGLGTGRYKLVYTTGDPSFATYNTVKFIVDAETDSSGIQSLDVVNESENPLFTYTTDAKTGTIKATFVGIVKELVNLK